MIYFDQLDVAKLYLFGNVQFLDLLLLLFAIDIVTGLVKAYHNRNLWSRKSLFGFTRKMMILAIVILANVIDQILGLEGIVTFATIIFYIANEGLSIVENLAEIGVLVPKFIADKLHYINEKNEEELSDKGGRDLSELREEFTPPGYVKKHKVDAKSDGDKDL